MRRAGSKSRLNIRGDTIDEKRVGFCPLSVDAEISLRLRPALGRSLGALGDNAGRCQDKVLKCSSVQGDGRNQLAIYESTDRRVRLMVNGNFLQGPP